MPNGVAVGKGAPAVEDNPDWIKNSAEQQEKQSPVSDCPYRKIKNNRPKPPHREVKGNEGFFKFGFETQFNNQSKNR